MGVDCLGMCVAGDHVHVPVGPLMRVSSADGDNGEGDQQDEH